VRPVAVIAEPKKVWFMRMLPELTDCRSFKTD